MSNNEAINELNRKIDFWETKIKKSKNMVEKACLADKIADARREISMLIISKSKEQEIHDCIDVPMAADKTQSQFGNIRGMVYDSSPVETFRMSL